LKIIGHKLCQFIIKKYIKGNVNWAKEIKIAQNLIKQYKDYSFWNNLNEIKLNSLAWFLTEDGKTFISLQKKRNQLKENKIVHYQINDKKIGQDKKTCQKPRNVLEFIKSWEENQKKK